jgi:hypothetical protein
LAPTSATTDPGMTPNVTCDSAWVAP